MLCWDSAELFDINFCNISLALGERVESTLLLFLFLFIICDITLFPASVTPNAARSPTAPRRGFAIRSLFCEIYEPTFLNVLDKESTNPLP